MERGKKPSAEELLRKILELEERNAHLKQEISKKLLLDNRPKRDYQTASTHHDREGGGGVTSGSSSLWPGYQKKNSWWSSRAFRYETNGNSVLERNAVNGSSYTHIRSHWSDILLVSQFRLFTFTTTYKVGFIRCIECLNVLIEYFIEFKFIGRYYNVKLCDHTCKCVGHKSSCDKV